MYVWEERRKEENFDTAVRMRILIDRYGWFGDNLVYFISTRASYFAIVFFVSLSFRC